MKDYIHIGRAGDLTDKKDREIYRFLEIFPGLIAWLTLILVVTVSFISPVLAAFFIIVFDVYWLVKTIYLSLLIRSSFFKMRKNLKINWLEVLKNTSPRSREIESFNWRDIYHLVIFPTHEESYEIIRSSFESVAKSNYPLDKLIVVLGTEERSGRGSQETARRIEDEFGNKFFRFLITRHPDGLPGEIRGKGSNETWAGREAKKEIIDFLNIDYRKIIVSVFDADTTVHPNFFPFLTYNFMNSENPLRSSFQPIPLFINNIWEAPAFARVFAFATTFWQMIQQGRPEQLVTFSSQSISFKALVDIGFWQTNVVSEDSRIFWQCFLHYDGDWRTAPMYFPVYMDANVAPTFWQTLKNQYKQIRRWHYGAENNPYFLFGFLKNKKIPGSIKWHFSLVNIERTHSSPTNALIIFILGWLPLIVGGSAFSINIISYNLPKITAYIMSLAMVGLITSAVLTIFLLPPRPPNYGKYKWLFMVLQWLLFPVNFIVFGAIPALDAQTRMMFGKYLGFWTTPKVRK